MLPPSLTGSGLDLQGQAQTLPPPSLKTFFEAKVEEIGNTLEIRNSEDYCGTSLFLSFDPKPELYRFYTEPSEVILGFTSVKVGSVVRLSALSSPSNLRVKSLCVSRDRGWSINVYPTGRKLMPMLSLGCPMSVIDACK